MKTEINVEEVVSDLHEK